MHKVKGKSVDAILTNLNSQQKEIAEKLRLIVKKTLPNTIETVKWGNITYLLNGENMAWILIYREHVDFGFFMGARLKSALLEGTGKNLRHIKIKSEKDIKEPEIVRLLKGAAKLISY